MSVGRCLPCPLGCSVSSWPHRLWPLPVALVPVTQWSPHSLLGQNEPDVGFPLVPPAVFSLVFQAADAPQ